MIRQAQPSAAGRAIPTGMNQPVNLSKSGASAAGTPPDHFEVLPPERGAGGGLPQQALSHLIAYLMDNVIKIPGLSKRIGVNPLLDLIPGIGDGAATLVQMPTILEGARRGVPKVVLARMGTNVLLNGAMGIVPFVGEAFSWWFRPSSRNYQLLLRHAPQDGTVQPRANHAGDYLFVFGLLAVVLVVMTIFIILGFYVLGLVFVPLWHRLFG